MRISVFFLILFMSATALAAEPDSVLVRSGEYFPALQGEVLDSIGVYRFVKGHFEAIPFQIDEKTYNSANKRYEYVLSNAYKGAAFSSLSNHVLDPQDEIAWPPENSGERFAGKNPFKNGYEIESENPKTGKKGYVYIGKLNPDASVVAVVLVKRPPSIAYDPVSDEVKTARYETRFLPDAPFAQGTLVLKNSLEGEAESVLDRFKMRFYLDLRFFFNLHLKEGDISCKRIGYKLGPVRLIRRLVVYEKIGPIRVTPKAMSDYVFSSDQIHIPNTVMTPFDPKAHLKDSSLGFGGFDFSEHFYGSHFYTEHNPVPVVLDGTMSAAEKALVREDVKWWVVTGSKGHFLVKVSLDDGLQAHGMRIGLHYQDDATVAMPPENEKGQSIAGFQIKLDELPQGNFQLFIDQYFPPKEFKQGDEGQYFGSESQIRYHVRAL